MNIRDKIIEVPQTGLVAIAPALFQMPPKTDKHGNVIPRILWELDRAFTPIVIACETLEELEVALDEIPNILEVLHVWRVMLNDGEFWNATFYQKPDLERML